MGYTLTRNSEKKSKYKAGNTCNTMLHVLVLGCQLLLPHLIGLSWLMRRMRDVHAAARTAQ